MEDCFTKPRSRAPTGMSAMLDMDTERSTNADKFEPVYIPENFKKTHNEKMQDQSRILQRLQGLMKEIRKSDNKQS